MFRMYLTSEKWYAKASKASLMKKLVLMAVVMLFVPVLVWSQVWLEGTNTLVLKDIRLQIQPVVEIRHAQNVYETLSFATSVTSWTDSCLISYQNNRMQLDVSIGPKTDFGVPAKQIRVSCIYHQTLNIRDILLSLNFLNRPVMSVLRGPQAIFAQDPGKNIITCPYTDRIAEYQADETSLWIAGSGYEGCENIQWIRDNSISLYDHNLHFSRRFDNTAQMFNYLTDTLVRTAGSGDEWSFLIFEEEPPILMINRWPGNKKAALVFTNDADSETEAKVRAVYFGSNDPNSPKYMTTGLVANNIPVTHTVFGVNVSTMSGLWEELKSYGNTIGYHTYTSITDLSADTFNNLIYEMADFDVRSWIDHSWGLNFETLCHQGWDPTSPYYILPTLNASKIDYFWVGDNVNTNPFNAFNEPWRLPHRLWEYDGLERDIWFYGRTKMEGWEYYNYAYWVDMKHNLTPENLDRLLEENGLCIVYTHFSFNETASIGAFYHYPQTGICEIKDEANACFEMVNNYQMNRGLWVATLEDVFDRMLAIEDLRIVSAGRPNRNGAWQVTLANRSSRPIEQLLIRNFDQEVTLTSIGSNSESVLILDGSTNHGSPNPQTLDIFAFYRSGQLVIKHKSDEFISPIKLSIYNIKGQKIDSFERVYSQKEILLPIGKYASGVYLLKAENGSGLERTVKFTVVK